MKKMLHLFILLVCNVTFVSFVYAQTNSWDVDYYGSLNNKAASVSNDKGKFIVDENICHLRIWSLETLVSMNQGIKANIDGQKNHVFDYKAEGTNDPIMTFKVNNEFINQLKQGNKLHILYSNKGKWHEITFTLKNSSRSIADSNDGHYYNLESESLEKKSL